MTDNYRLKGAACLYFIKNDMNRKNLEELVFKSTENEKFYKIVLHQVCFDLFNRVSLIDVINFIKNNKILRNHTSYYECRVDEEEQDGFIMKPFEVSEGIVVCKCGSNKVFSYSKQSRSADEPMTTYASCTKCKASWVINT